MTISLILDMASQTWPERTALGSRGHGVTFGQLAADAAAGAAALRRLEAGTREKLELVRRDGRSVFGNHPHRNG